MRKNGGKAWDTLLRAAVQDRSRPAPRAPDRVVAIDALTPETEGSYDPEVLAKMVEATLALLPADGFGRQSADDWATYATWMHDNGLLESEVDGAQATTNDYLP